MLGVKRLIDSQGVLEDWVLWMVRSTELAKSMAEELGIGDWVAEVHRRKYGWAAQVCRRQDERWTLQALRWSVKGSRKRGRPLTRWSDSFTKLFKGISPHPENGGSGRNDFCMAIAEDETAWNNLESDYLNFVMGL